MRCHPFSRPRGALWVTCLCVGLAALPACSILVNEEETDCGDGLVEGLEECEGPNFAGESCETLGYLWGHLVCTPLCRIETFNCHVSVCGDGYCGDDESVNMCPADCPTAGFCGDGKCETAELGVGCPDCDNVECGDGYCVHPVESDMLCDDCSSAFYCGDGTCHAWERDVSGRCSVDCGGGA
ncbi:MAG: hypothetical protein ABI333_21725 [bacterium]